MSNEDVEVTEEQAHEALRTAFAGNTAEPEYVPQTEQPSDTQTDEPAGVVASGDGEEVQEGSDFHEDDLESLKARLGSIEQEREKERQESQSRLEAFRLRNQENEKILRDKFLRKSAAADYARQVLQKALTEEGAGESEIKQVLEKLQGTMNPASANYSPEIQQQQQYQQYQQYQQQQSYQDPQDQVLTMNNFLNEKNMSPEEATTFGNWLRTDAVNVMSPVEQNIAQQNVDAFLRIAHNRWKEGASEQEKTQARQDAVQAVKAVQRTQKEAQKATSGRSSAPIQSRGTPPAKSAQEVAEAMTKADVSILFQQLVDRYD